MLSVYICRLQGKVVEQESAFTKLIYFSNKSIQIEHMTLFDRYALKIPLLIKCLKWMNK